MTAGAMTLEEISGERRKVVLTGRGLPYRPFTLRGSLRANVTWLNGSPEGSSTVLGAKEEPSSLNGKWCDKYLDVGLPSSAGEAPPVTLNGIGVQRAYEAVQLFDSIRRSGSLLRVSWLFIVRVGHLSSFEMRILNSNDIEWSMDFTWLSQGDIPGEAVFATQLSAGDSVSFVKSSFGLLDLISLPRGFGLLTAFTNFLVDLVNGIQDLIYDLEDRLASLVRKVLSPIQAIRGLISVLSSIKSEARLMVDFLEGQVATNMIGERPKTASENPEFDDSAIVTFAQRLEAEKYRRELLIWAKEMESVANEQKLQQEAQIEGDIMGTYQTREGEDLRSVSAQFYGSPFEWRRIAQFNSLTTIEVPPGTLLLVPKINAGQGSQLERGV